MKIIKKNAYEKLTENEKFKKEIEIMKNMNHPNILRIYEYFTDKNYIYISMELCRRGDLYRYIQNNGLFSEQESCLLIHQVLQAMSHYHMRGIIHRDIKPQNILFSKNSKAKEK